ncbi:MAG: hypothetical protein RL494_1404 [Bacteroidota bacterium]|jgi:cell division transport system ATP-binding protein
MSKTILSLQDVNIYQSGNKIISDINLSINSGEFIYIIGKTGSGKSSFMKMLYADIPLTEGQGTIVDYDLNGLIDQDIPFLRRKIGMVFQDFKLLYDRTVTENLVFVLKATGWTDLQKINDKIEEVLQKVGMANMANKMPHQLSGGEQQCVAIARALLNDPELILADEPTGNLDPQTSSEILELLKKINAQGKTIIMATHDYALLMKYPSKTLKCEDGAIFEVVQRTI